jgi:signal transduction histidine kinase
MVEFGGGVAALAVIAALLATAALTRQVSQLETAKSEAAERAHGLAERSEELELFAGRVAHDVLSPLMAVSAGLELSRARLRGDAKAGRTLDAATRSLTRVQRTVDGLLEFARAGAHPPADAWADLREAVQGVVEDVRSEAAAHGVTVGVEPFETRMLPCSAGVLTSLVGNLVRNAVKHIDDSPVRQVTLRVRDADGRVRVEVQDTGPGIDEQLQASIFEPFVRAGSAAPGAGLGLATVKKLVTAHGGRVGLESKPGAGSTFWFELPLGR